MANSKGKIREIVTAYHWESGSGYHWNTCISNRTLEADEKIKTEKNYPWDWTVDDGFIPEDDGNINYKFVVEFIQEGGEDDGKILATFEKWASEINKK